MKKRNLSAYFKYHILFLLLFALLLNTAMITGCNDAPTPPPDEENKGNNTEPPPANNSGSSVDGNGSESFKKNNTVAEEFLISMSEEGTEYTAESFINATNLFSFDISPVKISVKNGNIKVFNAEYSEYKLDTGNIELRYDFNKTINDLESELSESQKSILDIIKNFEEFYILTCVNYEPNHAIVISYRDTVYFMPTMAGKVIAILTLIPDIFYNYFTIIKK